MVVISVCLAVLREINMKTKSILIILAVVIIAIVIFAIYYVRCVMVVYDKDGMTYSDLSSEVSVSNEKGDE